MNLNPGLAFGLGPNDIPPAVIPGSLDPNAPIIRTPGTRTTVEITNALNLARRTGASPFVIAQLEREYQIALQRERIAIANGKTAAGTAGPVTGTASAGRDLLTFALLTAPAWGLLAAMKWMKPRRRAR